MSCLFAPLPLGPLTLPNRIVVAPMCQYSATDGNAGDWHLIHLGTLALSGAGLLTLEATAVSPEGRISPRDLGLYSDDNEHALARVLDAVRRWTQVPMAIQLSHAGRKGSSRVPWEGGTQISAAAADGWRTLAPSPVPHGAGEETPAALDEAGLDHVLEAFVTAAQRAARLGLQGIELHMTHGYLLHQFLSPLANSRTDDYGGALANRMRFPLRVFEAVRAAVPPHVAVWARIPGSDWVEGGWNVDDAAVLAAALAARGASVVHLSCGGVSPRQAIPLEPGYQVPFAREVRRRTGLAVIAVGLITEPRHAESIIADGDADAIALARALLYDPRWPWHAAVELGAQVAAPPQYWRCQPRERPDLFADSRHGQR